jgi:hypothetical protein
MIFRRDSIKEILSNQFFLLIIGGILTGLLVPYITTQWQNHEKELEIKTNLVSEISESVTRMLMAIQFVEVSQSRGINNSLKNEEYDNEYRDWKINSDVIQSQINAYFPSIDIDENWKKFSNAVEDLYALSGTSREDLRINLMQKIQYHLSKEINLTTWNILKNRTYNINNTTEVIYYQENWEVLKEQIIEEKENIIQRILNTKINL